MARVAYDENHFPYDVIAKAQAAWQVGDVAQAEELFLQGVDAYNTHEPENVDFALGRYGAFLLDQDRKDEALRVFEQAIERKTEIDAIWSDYIDIVSDRRNIGAFKRGIELMGSTVRHFSEPKVVLSHVHRLDRDGASNFAEEVSRWFIERSATRGDKDGYWSAVGVLGRILERAGRADEALKMWRDAFDEGSRDSETATRLAMHLERAKDYDTAITVIRKALARGLPATVEESLRKRLARLENRAAGKRWASQGKTDVPAYSVRHGSPLFKLIFQTRLKTSIRDFALVGNVGRCLLTTKELSMLADIDLETGVHVRLVDGLPHFLEMFTAPDGRGIGIRRMASVGEGPTLLGFINAGGTLTSETSVPDAISEIAAGTDIWYVGCRNGLLYGFGSDGTLRWSWEMPGSKDWHEDKYYESMPGVSWTRPRPCPDHVVAQQSFAVVTSWKGVYAIASNGETLWHTVLRDYDRTTLEFNMPLQGDQAVEDPYGVLGLPVYADEDEVKSAYRRLTAATAAQPDYAVGQRLQLIRAAYESILAYLIRGLTGTASFVAANSAGVIVGSYDGRLFTFDENGSLREARVLGHEAFRAALRPDGVVGAAWCDRTLLFLKDNLIVDAPDTVEWPDMIMFGEDVVLWRGNKLQVMDASGQLLWSVEFSRSIRSVAVRRDTLICAAGVLTAFRR